MFKVFYVKILYQTDQLTVFGEKIQIVKKMGSSIDNWNWKKFHIYFSLLLRATQ